MNAFAVNLNENVSFKLTDKGNDIIDKYIEVINSSGQINLKREYIIKSHDSGLEYMQLWYFMNIFGEHFHNGRTPVIEDNKLYFDI